MGDLPDLTLALLLKRMREERGISQESLASQAEITSSALSRIERGLNNPRWTTIKKIAKALDVRLVDVARGVEPDEDEPPDPAVPSPPQPSG